MYVKDHMTKNPLTVKRGTVLSEALEIMRENNFHRLPVVDDAGRLIGLVTAGLVEEDLDQLADDAMADACFPGNPKPATHEQVVELFRKIMA